jgi:hypothetical protein
MIIADLKFHVLLIIVDFGNFMSRKIRTFLLNHSLLCPENSYFTGKPDAV